MDISEFLDYVPDHEKQLYVDLATFMGSLGYRVKRAKTKDVNYVFLHKKIKNHILKYSIDNSTPKVKVKFYISDTYSDVFRDSIRYTIEEYNYKYTGCYKCGRCESKPLGYIYTYPNKRSYFRCGR